MTGDPDIEAGYVFRQRHPERTEVYARFDAWSAEARAGPGFAGVLRYGPHPREAIDLFAADDPAAPLAIFFHGGYWQGLDRARFSFVGERLRRRGITTALPSYPLCPEVTLDALLRSAGRAVEAIHRHMGQKGRAPARWMLAGHSAGGHIAARLAGAASGGPAAAPARCVAISGIFDLAPLRATSLNAALALTPEDAARLSVRPPGPNGPLMRLAVGKEETPAFLDQSRRFRDRVAQAGGFVHLRCLDGANHYTILEDFMLEPSTLLRLFDDSE